MKRTLLAFVFVAYSIGILVCLAGSRATPTEGTTVPNVTGRWKSLDSEGDTALLELVQEGRQIRGTISQWDVPHTISTGMIERTTITLTVAEEPLTVTLKAIVKGDRMIDGTSVDSKGHQTTWTARKQ